MIGVCVAIAAVAVVPLAGEVVARRTRLAGEEARKIVHAGSGVVAALLPRLVSYPLIIAIALVSAAGMLVVRRYRLLAALDDIGRASLGEVWFPLGVAALAALFPGRAYVYGTLVLGLADAVAAVVGIRFGRRCLPLLYGKTAWGSGAFCATTVLVGTAVGGGISLAVIAAAALLTAAEAVSSRGVDNLVVPLVAGLLATQVLWP